MDADSVDYALLNLFEPTGIDTGPLEQEIAAVEAGDGREFPAELDAAETGYAALRDVAGFDAVTAAVDDLDIHVDDTLPINSINYALPAVTVEAVDRSTTASGLEKLCAAVAAEFNPRNLPNILPLVDSGSMQDYYIQLLYRPHSKIDHWRLAFPLQYIQDHATSSSGVTTPTLKEEVPDRYPDIFTSESQVGAAVKTLRELLLVKQGRDGRAYAYWPLSELTDREAAEAYDDRVDGIRDTVREHVDRYYTPPGDEEDAEELAEDEGEDAKPQMTTLCDFQ